MADDHLEVTNLMCCEYGKEALKVRRGSVLLCSKLASAAQCARASQYLDTTGRGMGGNVTLI